MIKTILIKQLQYDEHQMEMLQNYFEQKTVKKSIEHFISNAQLILNRLDKYKTLRNENVQYFLQNQKLIARNKELEKLLKKFN